MYGLRRCGDGYVARAQQQRLFGLGASTRVVLVRFAAVTWQRLPRA